MYQFYQYSPYFSYCTIILFWKPHNATLWTKSPAFTILYHTFPHTLPQTHHPPTSNSSPNANTHSSKGHPTFWDLTSNDMLCLSERYHKFQPAMKLTRSFFFFFPEMVILATILFSFSLNCTLTPQRDLQKSYYKCRMLLLETALYNDKLKWYTLCNSIHI